MRSSYDEYSQDAMTRRLLEANAEIDRLREAGAWWAVMEVEHREAVERLAAVIELCDDPASSDNGPGWFRFEVRAAATGDTT